MKFSFSVRLWILVLSLFVVAGGTIYGFSSTWHRIHQLEATLTHSQIERFQLAGEIRHELPSLNSAILRYALVRDPQQWAQFEQDSGELNRWINDHDPNLNPHSPLTTETERQVFKELNRAYSDYINSARAVYSNAQPALVSSKQLAQLDAFNVQAKRMRNFTQQLTDAHRTAENAFLANANASLVSLRKILIASILLVLVLVAAMGCVIYRDKIAPLQTRLVHSQNLLERQEKLATLGTLAAGIAHEIRNPLTALKARLYTLEKHVQSIPAAKRDTDIINAEILRLEHIVTDVLSFARPSDPKLETISADTIIREVQALLTPDLQRRGLDLTVESDTELFIRADGGQLKQVLINLVRNAAEAMDSVGTVTLRVRTGYARFRGHEGRSVILEVRDTGKGISAEAEKRLFDPFFSTKETGTGLGLSIAARIVENHGGILQYQTRPGHGTTFGVVLPREIDDIAKSGNYSAHIQT